MKLWTIYDHPIDIPTHFVVRGCEVSGHRVVFDSEPKLFDSLEGARQTLRAAGLVCFGREPEDDPVVVEVWL